MFWDGRAAVRFTARVSVQRLGMAPSASGGRVAFALTGSGPFLVVVPGWLGHLELETISAVIEAVGQLAVREAVSHEGRDFRLADGESGGNGPS